MHLLTFFYLGSHFEILPKNIYTWKLQRKPLITLFASKQLPYQFLLRLRKTMKNISVSQNSG